MQTAPEFALGYYRFASHELLPIEQCPISSPLINRSIAAIYAFAKQNPAPAGTQELELFANAEDAELCLEIYCSLAAAIPEATSWAERLQANFPAITGAAIFQQHPGKHEPVLAASLGTPQLTYRQQSIAYKVSAGAFFQVNRHLIGKLTDIVTANVAGKVALDLYAGVGLFSTRLAATFAQVIAVDSSPTSHADLRYNSPPNVKAVRATAEQYLAKQQQQPRRQAAPPDLVVVDPPRSGLGERAVNALVKLAPHRITYVSCDPATLARDLRRLLASGYRIEQAHLVDLFPQTYHLESVFHLAR